MGGARSLTRRQSSIKGLVVQETNAGLVGQVVDIIATTRPLNGAVGTASLLGDIGPQMTTAFEEAQRLVEFRYPDWGGGDITLSFGDKYSSKDGGSAGAAMTLLMISIIDRFDIDPTIAMTGDISVDGKVRKIGALNAKVRGAILDHAAIVAIPEENAPQIDDIMLLQNDDAPWSIQIVSIATIDQAIALARTDRDPAMAEALELFKSLQEDRAAHKGGSLGDPKTAEKLEKVVKLLPGHQSAKSLLQMARHQSPRTLTVESTLAELGVLLSSLEPSDVIARIKNGTATRQDAMELRSHCLQISRMAAPETRRLMNAANEYAGLVADAYNAGKLDAGLLRKLDDSLNQLYAQLDAIGSNKQILEQLIR